MDYFFIYFFPRLGQHLCYIMCMLVTSTSFAISIALAGLGVFLIAVKLMSNSLRTMSGGFTVRLMKKFSANRFLALGVGIIFTTMIQSSDGAVALAIGLIAAGFMNLRSAIPFILGANIGTATTSLIVYFGAKVEFTQYFMIFAFIGAMGYLIIKEEKKSNIAMLVFSIGALFVGLKILGSGMKFIAHTDEFKSVVTAVSVSPWSALFTSIGMTGIMQSSSATVTIVQNVYQGGSMGIQSAIAMVIGANIGTTFTALLTSIGANKDAKRIAVVWLITNIAIAAVVMPIIMYYGNMVDGMASDKMLKLAFAHLIFNGILVFVFIWLVDPLVWLSNWIIKDEEATFAYNIRLSESLIADSPAIAYESVKNATYELALMTEDSLRLLYKYVDKKDPKVYKKFKELEKLINLARKNIFAYLVELGAAPIPKRIANKQMSLVLVAKSLELVPTLGHEIATSINKTAKKNKDKTIHFEIQNHDHESILKLLKINISLSKRATMQMKRTSSKRHEEMIDLSDALQEQLIISRKQHVRNQKEKSEFDFFANVKLLERMALQNIKISKYRKKGAMDVQFKKLSTKLEKELIKNV